MVRLARFVLLGLAALCLLTVVMTPHKAIWMTRSRIPQILLFNHRVKLIDVPLATLSEPDRLLALNVQRTIAMFPSFRVVFFDDEMCQTAMRKFSVGSNRTMEDLFRMELRGSAKSDFCRLIMLFEYGGFYFDTDLVVLHNPIPLLGGVEFATVAAGRYTFFQAFIASIPKHPLLSIAISNHRQYYLDSKNLDRRAFIGSIPGPVLLREAFDIWASPHIWTRCLQTELCERVNEYSTILLRETCPKVNFCGCDQGCSCYVESLQGIIPFLSRMKRPSGALCSCGEQLLPFHRGLVSNPDCSVIRK